MKSDLADKPTMPWPAWGVAALLVVLVAGCASGPEAGGSATSGAGSGPRRPEPTVSQRVLSHFTNVENGLETRQWVVQGGIERIGDALMAHGAVPALDEALDVTYRRNGLRFVRVPIDQLPAIQAALEPLSLNLTEWHGELTGWRELHERAAGSGQVVAVSGRVRSFSGGTFELLARGWVVPMEDGPFLHLDLVPCFVEPQLRDPLLARVRERRGERFDELAVTARLEPEFAYMLTAEAPGVIWPGEQREEAPAGGQLPSSRRGLGPGAGPASATGPAAVGAVTLGTLLLGGETQPPSRGVLVFVPRIAADVYPPSPLASGTSAAGAATD